MLILIDGTPQSVPLCIYSQRLELLLLRDLSPGTPTATLGLGTIAPQHMED